MMGSSGAPFWAILTGEMTVFGILYKERTHNETPTCADLPHPEVPNDNVVLI